MIRRAVFVLLALAACEKPKPKDEAAPAKPQAAAPADAAPAAPAAADAAGAITCGVRYALTTNADGARTLVTATATNLGAAGVTIELADRCPSAPIALLGLPAGYDPDGACLKGMCPPEEESRPVSFDVDPGATVTLSSWTIDPGKGSCNEALAAGSYDLTFDAVAPVGGGTTCGPAAVTLAVGAAKKPAKQPPHHANPPPDDMPTAYHCPRMPACGIGCPGPMAKDEHGCTLCACAPDPLDKLRP